MTSLGPTISISVTECIMSALELSIAHWERNAAATTPADIKMGTDHCALCQDYFHNSCMGCPVYHRTGLSGFALH